MYSIPSTRTITWQGNVGVKGDIPSRTTIYTTLGVAGQASTYAQSVTRTQIQTALTNCSSGQVVYLNAGTYTLTSGNINIPSNVTLRGAGIDHTILTHATGTTMSPSFIHIGSDAYTDPLGLDGSPAPNSSMGSTYTKNATQITLASAASFTTGTLIWVDELNDDTIPVVPLSSEGSDTDFCGIYASSVTRAFCCMHEITNKSGNVLTIDPPAIHTFPSGLTPRAYVAAGTPTYRAGIEDLTLKNPTGSSASSNEGVRMAGSRECWVLRVKVENHGDAAIFANHDVFRPTIRGCWFKGVLDKLNADNYPVKLYSTAFPLVEDCIFDGTCNAVVLQTVMGGVYAYNYTYSAYRTRDQTDWFWSDYWTHGTHCAYNLYEGNIGNCQNWDAYWGSNSHNTSYRNRWRAKDPLQPYGATIQTCSAIATSRTNTYANEIGNILGTAGWNTVYENNPPSPDDSWTSKPIHAIGGWGWSAALKTTKLRHCNYDYVTNSMKIATDSGEPGVQGGDADTTLPSSLYLASKPSWYGGWTWPPIVPSTATTNTLPAQGRYEGLSDPDVSPPVGTPVLSVR